MNRNSDVMGQFIDELLKSLLSRKISSGQLRADDIDVDALLREVYTTIPESTIGPLIRRHAAAQEYRRRAVKIMQGVHRIMTNSALVDILCVYLSEHRHARILSGIATCNSESDMALQTLIREVRQWPYRIPEVMRALYQFLKVAEEPDMHELEVIVRDS